MYRPQPTGANTDQRRGLAKTLRLPDVVTATFNDERSGVEGVIDVLFHVALWVTVIVFEFMVFLKADGWNKTPKDDTVSIEDMQDTHTFPYAAAALVCTLVSSGMIGVLILGHWSKFAEMKGPTDPMFVAIIKGALQSSLLFTFIGLCFWGSVAKSGDKDFTSWCIFLLIGKLTLCALISQNVMRSVKKDMSTTDSVEG